MNNKNFQFKVVLLGEGCVGKTSLILRYVNDQFNEYHLSTVQAAFLKKKIKIGKNISELAIWDTAGQERYHALGPIYYRGSNGAILVYDITDVDSFERIKSWVKEIKASLGNNCVLCIVGNKTDLENNRNVLLYDAEQYAYSVGADHFSTSAKLNKGVNELFLEITKKMTAKMEEINNEETFNGNTNNDNKKNLIKVVDDNYTNSELKKSTCC